VIPLWFFLLSGGVMYLLDASVMHWSIYRNLRKGWLRVEPDTDTHYRVVHTIKKGASQ